MVIGRYYEAGWKVRTTTYTDTDIGGREVDSTTDVTVAGRMRPLSGDERLSADKQTLYATHRFYTDPVTVGQDDNIISPDGDLYRVVFVKDVMTMGRHLEIDCEWVGHDE